MHIKKGENYMNFNEFNNQDEFNNIEQNLDDVYSKYSSYSENELMQEFLKQTQIQKQNGALDMDKLEQVKQVLLPYLDESQKETLEQILNKIK